MEIDQVKKLKTDFERDGYVFIPGFFSNSRIEEIKAQLDHFISCIVPLMPSNYIFYEDKQQPETLKQLQNMHEYSSFFDQLMNGSELENLAATLLDEQVIGKNIEYFNKPPRIGKATPPHQDAYYFTIKPAQAVTMWLALEDADPENGCVNYLAGSHKKGMRPHGRTQTLGFSQHITDYGTLQDLEELQICRAKPGDLIVHHCMTVHAAGNNQSETRTRKALGFIYFGKSAQIDLEAKEAYKKSLQAQQVS